METYRQLVERRGRALGPAYEHFYQDPLYIVRGEGVWLFDDSGKKYLDCYNNVPSVGHCHPHVVGAISTQIGQLNTHTRYLHHGIVEFAEKLADTLPGDLSVCTLVCTGTEANDLAYRIASTVTGNRGAIVTSRTYHGNSTLVHALSTSSCPVEQRPGFIETIESPDIYRGSITADHPDPWRAYANQVDDAIASLADRGHAPAMLLTDNIHDDAGAHTPGPAYLQTLYPKVREAGGLVVADEVQSGLCRLGDNYWGFMDSGVVPDIVTMGKPMGDGHPLAVVVTTPAIAEAFAKHGSYFNTFGGNPVSAAAGKAVLEVVEREELLANVHDTGQHFRAGMLTLAEKHDLIGDVRGKGFFYGVDLVTDRQQKTPAAKEAGRIHESMRDMGVLVSTVGEQRNILKIRPPLVFRKEHADIALDALDKALDSV